MVLLLLVKHGLLAALDLAELVGEELRLDGVDDREQEVAINLRVFSVEVWQVLLDLGMIHGVGRDCLDGELGVPGHVDGADFVVAEVQGEAREEVLEVEHTAVALVGQEDLA